jgi:hypothetical protein
MIIKPYFELAWFDPETSVLSLDEIVSSMPSFRRIMEDGVVTEQEFRDQAHLVSTCLRELESVLSPELKPLVTKTICELAVLFMTQKLFAQQQ